MVIGEGAGDADGVGWVGGDVGGGVARRVSCQYCGMAVTSGIWRGTSASGPSCRVWDPGGGGNCGQR